MTQEFLDTNQYTEISIMHYEQIYGHNYISPGGMEVADQFISTLNLRPAMRVLDIGCGLGGPAFRMAKKHYVNVDGIDISANMIRIAISRLKEEGLESLVNLKLANCLELNDESIYELVHSRDVFLHVKNKDLLFEVILNAMVSGGRLCFSDYCLGQTKPSVEFNTYLHDRNYSLLTVTDYTKILKKAGFKNVRAEDRTDHFIEILKHELLNLENSSLKEHEKYILQKSWMDKIKRADNGEQSWAWFYGEKF